MEQIEFCRSDWAQLEGKWQDLVRESFHSNYGGMGEAYIEVIDAEGKIDQMKHYIEGLPVWAACAGDRLAGLLCARIDGDRLVLYDLYVSGAFQRQGIVRSLVALAIQECHPKIVTAEVNRDNVASQALFQALNFQREITSDWFVLRLEEGDQ